MPDRQKKPGNISWVNEYNELQIPLLKEFFPIVKVIDEKLTVFKL